METVSTKKFIHVWVGIIVIIGLFAIVQTIQRTTELEIILLRSRWILLVGVFALTSLAGLWFLRSSLPDRLAAWMDKLGSKSSLASGILLVASGFLIVWFVRLYIFGGILPKVMPILWVFLWASLVQVFGLKLIQPSLRWHTSFAIILLVQGMIYQLWGIFAAASTDPFSMGYSEAGRHFYASLFFSEKLYGMKLPLPFLHPSRYLLLSIPFLIDGLPLWAHRFWQALLWFALTLGASYSLAWRMRLKSWAKVLVTAWAFLFFLQGAVYYHLQICVILVLIGVHMESGGSPPKQSIGKANGFQNTRALIIIIVASLWAGISRVNWFPVPAMLAIALYVLETPLKNRGWKYWITPAIWGIVGIASALLSQFIYIQVSGNADVSSFGSSFTSQLIWARLIPNETFPLGIIPGILLVSGPLMIAFYQMIRGKMNLLHPFRWLALLAMLFVLFVGGAVVSTKIGGGGDLHNMDAFLVMLSVVVMAFWTNQVKGDEEPVPMWGRVGWGVTAAALLIPLGFAIRHIGFYPTYDSSITAKNIQLLQESIQTNGEILFITERQLITFDYLHGVRLVPEYEQSELMEMAMSRNQPYLEKYYDDLHNRRFALIIAEEQKFTEQKHGAFMEEDAAWVHYVGVPLLCNYKPVLDLASNNIQVFEPRPKQAQCKDPFAE